MISDREHLFFCLLDFCKSFWKNVCPSPLPIFYSDCLVSCCQVVGVLYIGYLPFIRYMICNHLWFARTTNCGKFFKRWEYQTTLPDSWEIYMQVRNQQLELDMEQQTGSKLGKEYIKAVYCHLAHLTYMQSTSCEMTGLMKHKLESRLPGEISITSDTQMTPPLWQKVKKK